MPLTLKRYVNGQVVPIRLSILDAFRGTPAPPRKKKGVAANISIASAIAKPTPAPTKTVEAPAPTTTNGTDNSSTITKQGDDEAHTFTEADDAKLIEMKAAGNTWKEIVAETKKSQSALKERYKEISPKADGGSGAAGGGDQVKKGSEAKADEDKKAATTGKKGKRDASNTSGMTEESTTATPTHPFSINTNHQNPTNPTSLAEIAAKYDKNKWRFAASKYYDITGVRISQEDARQRAEKEAKAEAGKREK